MKSKRGMGSATRGGGCVVKRAGGTPPNGESAAEGLGFLKGGRKEALSRLADITAPMLKKPKPKTMKTKSGKRLPLEPMIKR